MNPILSVEVSAGCANFPPRPRSRPRLSLSSIARTRMTTRTIWLRLRRAEDIAPYPSWLFVRLVRRLFGCAHSNARLNLWGSLLLGIFLPLMSASAAGLVDVWRADDLNLN